MFRKHRLLSQCWRHLALAGLLFLSAGLNLYNNTFPLGYHYDEPKKVRFVKSGDQDFHHPLLMLQIVRIANRVLGYRDDHKIVVLGRSTMALVRRFDTAVVLSAGTSDDDAGLVTADSFGCGRITPSW